MSPGKSNQDAIALIVEIRGEIDMRRMISLLGPGWAFGLR
jgi:hypothetical protein